MLSVGTLDVLGKVLDLSADSAVLTKVDAKVLLDRSRHRGVSVAGPGEFSDLVVAPVVTKRYNVTAEDFSLWELEPKITPHSFDVCTAGSRIINNQRQISHHVDQRSGLGSGQYAVKEGISSASIPASDALRSTVARIFGRWFVCAVSSRAGRESRSAQGLPDVTEVQAHCRHPPRSIRSGSNQHGTWTICQKCTAGIRSKGFLQASDPRGQQPRVGQRSTRSS